MKEKRLCFDQNHTCFDKSNRSEKHNVERCSCWL